MRARSHGSKLHEGVPQEKFDEGLARVSRCSDDSDFHGKKVILSGLVLKYSKKQKGRHRMSGGGL
jgi:hypothetical protein